MHARLRTAARALVVPVLAASMIAGGASAYAGAARTDATVVTVTKNDKAHDVKVEKKLRKKVTPRVRNSVDVRRVSYTVDKTAGTFTATYTMRHKPVSVRPYKYYYATAIVADPTTEEVPLFMMSRPGKSTIHLFDLSGAPVACAGAKATATKHRTVITQVVPLSCFTGKLTHGRIFSVVAIDRRQGDVAWDMTAYTGNVPVTAAP